jgi:hypothetical protein
MSNVITLKPTDKTVEDIVRDLVRFERINGALFVNLPMIYPDGSFVTVRIDRSGTGYIVSDAGFTFREVGDIAGSRSFRRAANRIAQANEVIVGERHLYVESDLDTLTSNLRRSQHIMADCRYRRRESFRSRRSWSFR